MPTGQLHRVFIPGGGFQMRTNGEASPVYGPGWADVPDDVLYTLSLMPAYAATDAQGRPLSNTLAAASLGDRAAVAHSSMPAPDASFARGEVFDTSVPETADPRSIHTQDAVDAALSGERQGASGETLADSLVPDTDTTHVFPVKGQTELAFTQRRQVRDEVRRLQQAHEQAIERGDAKQGTKPALVSADAERIADEFDDEFGAGESSSVDKSLAEYRKVGEDGAGESGASGRAGGGARKRSGGRKSASRSASKSARKGGAKRARKPRARGGSTSAETSGATT